MHERRPSRVDAIGRCSDNNGTRRSARTPSWLRHPAAHRLADHTTHVYFHANNPMVGNAFIALNYPSHDRKKWPKSLQFYGIDIDFSCQPRDAPNQFARFLLVPCDPPAVSRTVHRPRGGICPVRPRYRRHPTGTLANAIRPPPLSGTIKTNGRYNRVYGVAHEPWIVVLSILVAIQGSYVALGLTLRVSSTEGISGGSISRLPRSPSRCRSGRCTSSACWRCGCRFSSTTWCSRPCCHS